MSSTPIPLILEAANAEVRAMDDVELRRQLERVHADCFGWAMACCGRDSDDAEEVLQTVYLTVLDGHARYDGRSSFRTWLFGVIRRTALSRRRTAWLRGLLLERNGERMRPEAPAPTDAKVESDSRSLTLRNALAHLAARQQQVLHLVFYQDLTVDEAAAVMGMSVGSARTHYARGKARLATLLGDARDL
ncbi:MAG TPA: RNA polymerase sigma factor [Gemmatimonadaceae bacterium]|nr:RNA polymerase sigma factor [Gemmatimonadaceae bacterium]